MERVDGTPGWYRWPGVVDAADHLSRLASAAAGRPVSVSIDEAIEAEGVATIDSAGDWHVLLNPDLAAAEAEGTTLHETGHLLLGHVGDALYAENVQRDWHSKTDRYRAPEEIEADALAAALLPSVVDCLSEPLPAVMEVLHEDAARFYS